jgi:molybdopterin-synthase adenylyltransferase
MTDDDWQADDLRDDERATYEWQMWVDGFGEAGQKRLKNATVMVSRVGGLGSVVAYELAAAGIGRLILAHAGNVKPSDLNRQLLMTHDWIGKPRIESAERRLKELNPRLEIVALGENVSEQNVDALVKQADVVVDCAPLFQERFAMNRASVQLGKPLVECAMYELQCQITTYFPGKTGCLACLSPVAPESWKREFPVFGAVSGSVGCIAAMEAIKLISGLGQPLFNRMLVYDLRTMRFATRQIGPNPDCRVCGGNQD